MNKKIIAVVGCGYWGKNLVRNFYELGALAAVCDGNPETAQNMSQNYNVPFLSFDEILNDKSIKGVVIAAPAGQHYSLAKQAMQADKHVFVEKPLALEIKHAEELCQISESLDKVLMVGHLLQYHPAFNKLKELVANGDLGRLQYIYSNRLSLGKIRREENILWSFAPHDISMILSLVGELPSHVTTVGNNYLHEKLTDITTTHLSFPNGINAHIFVSWLHPYKEQKLVLVGDKGMAEFNDSRDWDNKIQLYPHKIEWIDGNPLPNKADAIAVSVKEDEPLKRECQHFLDCVQSNTRPRTDGREGLNVLRVLHQADQALTKHETVSNPKTSDYFVHESSYVDSPADIGSGTKIWHFSHILGRTKIGKNCNIGQNLVIGPNVTVGNNCKIQNNVSIYDGVTLDDGVFCGPSCVFTNVTNPRAEIEQKDNYKKTHVGKNATIGANATIVCGHDIGKNAFIAAGAVITKNVQDHALMAGVPAKQIGWMSHAGEKLDENLTCPKEGRKYVIQNDKLIEDKPQHLKLAS
jgi:UDP-2-acetamido-3-amino-2,3-dideoxy-glucuronate N-acetyltransferase